MSIIRKLIEVINDFEEETIANEKNLQMKLDSSATLINCIIKIIQSDQTNENKINKIKFILGI
ncbi:hypothetical protein [Intestinibacter sp.]|uniref:hypothetical protein n=1 Tax=Intestinibacter sp. TaxID=1965304 RepID=UPI003F1737DB